MNVFQLDQILRTGHSEECGRRYAVFWPKG